MAQPGSTPYVEETAGVEPFSAARAASQKVQLEAVDRRASERGFVANPASAFVGCYVIRDSMPELDSGSIVRCLGIRYDPRLMKRSLKYRT